MKDCAQHFLFYFIQHEKDCKLVTIYLCIHVFGCASFTHLKNFLALSAKLSVMAWAVCKVGQFISIYSCNMKLSITFFP